MMVVFLSIFVAATNVIYGYISVAPLTLLKLVKQLLWAVRNTVKNIHTHVTSVKKFMFLNKVPYYLQR